MPLFDLSADASPRTMASGQSITKGMSVKSPDGRISLTIQSDGNLVLTATEFGTVLWDAWAHGGTGGDRLMMQSDGNLVFYTYAGQPAWHTHTDGHPGAYLSLQNDGNMVVYGSDGAALWNAGTHILPSVVLAPSSSPPTGQPAQPGQSGYVPPPPPPPPSFMEGAGKYVVFGGLGLAALWYFKLRKKVS